MKKLITAMLALAAIAPLSAQQLPNNGFEEAWVQFKPWKTGTASADDAEVITPPGWTVSDVKSPTKFIVAEKIAEGYNGTSSVKIINKYVEAGTIKQYVPGYMTLGTTWSTSKGMFSITNKDGGSFGGYDFSYTPDAVSFVYIAEINPASIVAYMWNGRFEQNNVPGEVKLSGSPATTTMVDRDRQVLREAYPDYWTTALQGDANPTINGKLVAYNFERPAIAANWTAYTLPLKYISNAGAPEKINVIFSAGDYFTQPTSADKNNTMSVDDVKLLYYSRLKTLSVNGTEVTLTDGKYDYDLSESVYMPKSEEELSYELLGESPAKTVSVALDAENNKATITVKNTNEGATDVDGAAEHTYTITFKAPRVFTGIEYPGQITKLTMDTGEGPEDLIVEPTNASIWMTQKGTKRIVDVLLPDLNLGGDLGVIGDILVEDVTRSYNNNNGSPVYDYTGHVDDLSLLNGFIHAVVDLEGTSDVDGNVSFKIHVKWVANYDDLHPQAIVAREAVDPVYYPIEVEFNGKTATPEVPTGINDVTVDGGDAPVEYFDLQGIRVSNPQAGRMVIRRQGTNVEKILVK